GEPVHEAYGVLVGFYGPVAPGRHIVGAIRAVGHLVGLAHRGNADLYEDFARICRVEAERPLEFVDWSGDAGREAGNDLAIAMREIADRGIALVEPLPVKVVSLVFQIGDHARPIET